MANRACWHLYTSMCPTVCWWMLWLIVNWPSWVEIKLGIKTLFSRDLFRFFLSHFLISPKLWKWHVLWHLNVYVKTLFLWCFVKMVSHHCECLFKNREVSRWFAKYDKHPQRNSPSHVSQYVRIYEMYPDSKVYRARMGPTWVLSAPDGPHVGHMNFAIMLLWTICWC